jgi:glycosyltransferase involved in cell wall biosynthesis
MNISIVIPVYNEEKAIADCLQSVRYIDYPSDSYEVIVVNDGSTDATAAVVGSFDFVILINNERNIGRYRSRKKGVLCARYENILFADSRTLLDRDILKEIRKSPDGYPVQGVCHSLDTKGRPEEMTWFEIFYNLVRNKIYDPEKGDSFQYIREDNFDRMAKGTTVFYCPKQILLNAFSILGDGDVLSDDIRLLNAIAKQKSIVRNTQVKIIAYARKGWRKSLIHLFQRGPKFVDFYFKPGRRYFPLIVALLFFIVVNILILIIHPKILLYEAVMLVFSWIVAAVYLSKTVKDFFVSLCMLPVTVFTFSAGVLWGIIVTLHKTIIAGVRGQA